MKYKYGYIDADESSFHGYYIIKFYSSPYNLQVDLSIDVQVIFSDEMVCEGTYLFPTNINFITNELINTCCWITHSKFLNKFICILYFHMIFFNYIYIYIYLIHTSVLDLSTTDFINLSKLSTWEVFENPKDISLIPNVTIQWSQMCKWLITSWGLNKFISGSIILEA